MPNSQHHHQLDGREDLPATGATGLMMVCGAKMFFCSVGLATEGPIKVVGAVVVMVVRCGLVGLDGSRDSEPNNGL